MRDFICVFLFVVLALGCGRREQESAGETAPPSRLPVSGSVDVRLSEEEKIEALIRALGDLPGAIFVRNGQEHTAVEAMQHLRDKWAWKKSEIHSAEDFIRVTASASTITGRPYLIRLSDGTEVESGKWFKERLTELDQNPRDSGRKPDEP